jgi:hypothetical protein
MGESHIKAISKKELFKLKKESFKKSIKIVSLLRYNSKKIKQNNNNI